MNLKDFFEIKSIGKIRKEREEVWLELRDEFKAGLLNLDQISHVITLWWISGRDNEVDRNILQVHPKVMSTGENTPLCGVFATRSPLRPNPIGLTIVKILSIENNKIFIDRHDAFDETPLIDLKPYIPKSDCIINTNLPDFYSELREKREE
ncbi:MAG: tRNA (N6-threonylcarbamoyladenosine(37)-N6)-methyltransferase TrmO [Asgard group archaeon]|nr:tRNA (N6-threonylcarbamoyladenosine(37)-N6)-methyltransferase TrmO [Asgard group archaeon]